MLGDDLIQPIKGIVLQYLFGDQAVGLRLSKIPEDAVVLGAAIYVTTRCLEKKSSEEVSLKRGGEKRRRKRTKISDDVRRIPNFRERVK